MLGATQSSYIFFNLIYTKLILGNIYESDRSVILSALTMIRNAMLKKNAKIKSELRRFFYIQIKAQEPLKVKVN